MIVIYILISIAFAAPITATNIDKIIAPRVVSIPPSDAYIGLSKMPDGEIRHYNYGEQKVSTHSYYLSSKDNGITWRAVKTPEDLPFADIQSPNSGEYIRVFGNSLGVFCIRTNGGIEGNRTITKIDDKVAIMCKPPLFVDNGRKIIVAAHRTDRTGSITYMSADDGLTWRVSDPVNSPPHVSGGFHRGVRWNHGAVEPTITELPNGKLWMIMRTAQDKHYQSFSYDWGLNWSAPTPSPFYGTITMPTFHRLQDGRLLFFWCNTTPLPELETANGVWDDVFTNRNATHIAISDDNGKTWKGFRELFLDERRNAIDYADTKGIDKSVHQAQCIEIKPNKILVSIGQHQLHRKIILLDTKWILEKERECNFSDGLKSWSAFKYYKGIKGHCGYNRKAPEILKPHSNIANRNMITIGYTPNDSLVADNDGAVWNFPAARNGRIEIRFKAPNGSKSINLMLNDRWFNPSDSVAKHYAMYNIKIERASLKIKDNKWHSLRIVWNEKKKTAIGYVDNKRVFTQKLKNRSEHGISYLHLLGGNIPDPIGVSIDNVKMKVN